MTYQNSKSSLKRNQSILQKKETNFLKIPLNTLEYSTSEYIKMPLRLWILQNASEHFKILLNFYFRTEPQNTSIYFKMHLIIQDTTNDSGFLRILQNKIDSYKIPQITSEYIKITKVTCGNFKIPINTSEYNKARWFFLNSSKILLK